MLFDYVIKKKGVLVGFYVKKYKILSSYYIEDLEEYVNIFLSEGWKPFGGPFERESTEEGMMGRVA